VRDADAARQARFAAEHPDAFTADSPAAFAVADIVVTMLPNGGIVRDALLDWGIATARSRCCVCSAIRPGSWPRTCTSPRSVAVAAETDAPVIALADQRWAKALGQFGPAADQSRAHQSRWDDRLGES
jgi:3-hydroxyisobutyrate dehydrogenase-like beta-hydroxyacid dehydrogenase